MINMILKIPGDVFTGIATICGKFPKSFWYFIGVALIILSIGVAGALIMYGGIFYKRIEAVEADAEKIEAEMIRTIDGEIDE